MPDLWGYADLHCHPMAHLGFGARDGNNQFFWGRPYAHPAQPQRMASALPCCSPAHDSWQGNATLAALSEGDWPSHKKHGASTDADACFEDWPNHKTIVHQQMWFEWIHRAYVGGLRLMVASAVNNYYLASLYHGGDSNPAIRDMAAMKKQVMAMRMFCNQPDVASFMEIAHSADQARAIIENNKMAVVLAVEVDSLGGEDLRYSNRHLATQQRIDGMLDALRGLGVRLVTPIHLADNAFGGCAVYDDAMNCANDYLNKRFAGIPEGDGFWGIAQRNSGVDLQGVEFLLGRDKKKQILRAAYAAGYPAYVAQRTDGHINAKGLTTEGSTLLEGMMKRGMLIDVDHMGQLSLDSALGLAENAAYPVVCSHTYFRDLALKRVGAPDQQELLRGHCHEGMSSTANIRRIRDLGGLIGMQTNMGPVRLDRLNAHDNESRRLALAQAGGNCTSEDWSEAYRFLAQHCPDAIAVGTDFNGLAGQPGPRYNRNDGHVPEVGRRLDYDDPAELMVQGTKRLELQRLGPKRKLDLNDDGLVHYGLMPDFLKDVANLSGDGALTPLFRSAERFVTLWKTCENRAGQL